MELLLLCAQHSRHQQLTPSCGSLYLKPNQANGGIEDVTRLGVGEGHQKKIWGSLVGLRDRGDTEGTSDGAGILDHLSLLRKWHLLSTKCKDWLWTAVRKIPVYLGVVSFLRLDLQRLHTLPLGPKKHPPCGVEQPFYLPCYFSDPTSRSQTSWDSLLGCFLSQLIWQLQCFLYTLFHFFPAWR